MPRSPSVRASFPDVHPLTLGDFKQVGDRLEEHIEGINASLGPHAIVHFSLGVVPGPGEPTTPGAQRLAQLVRQPAPPRRRHPPRKSGLYAVLHAAQQHGITHPKDGYWLMLPREFDAILALEHKAVAQVVLEVLRQTIGRVGDGPVTL